jgi:hypothetical protein
MKKERLKQTPFFRRSAVVAETNILNTLDVEEILGETLNEQTGANVSTILEHVVIDTTVASLHFTVVMSCGSHRIERNFIAAIVHGKWNPYDFEQSVVNLAEVMLQQLKNEAAKLN